MTTLTPSTSSASYDAQLRIRREAEDRAIAQNDLNSWMSDLKLSKTGELEASKNRKVTKTKKDAARPTVQTNVASTSKPVQGSQTIATSFEDERLRGNQHFAKGKYLDAVQCYTRCLGDKDALKSPVVYSNRAMSYVKLKKWSQAEEDATSALRIDPKHYKSYQRRCVARLSLGKLRAAMMDACAADDCCMLLLKDNVSSSNVVNASLNEIRDLQKKVEVAMLVAVKGAPIRKIQVEVVAS